MASSPVVKQVAIRNYKSIASCDVRLGPLTLLAGANGSGKSNFLEALRFLAYALTTSPSQAVENRGGWGTVCHFAGQRVEVGLEFQRGEFKASYALGIELSDPGRFNGSLRVAIENCSVKRRDEVMMSFSRQGGKYQSSPAGVLPLSTGFQAAADGLLLPALAGHDTFGEVLRTLAGIRVYNPSPTDLRTPQPARPYRTLDRAAGNLGAMIYELQQAHRERLDRLMEYLSRIVPKVGHVEAVQSEGYFFLAFGGATAKHVSDGTLRAVALLAALFQPATDEGPSLIGIEEPEAGLHPAAAAILLGAMKERSRSTQVIATSHSPEMLDELRLEEDLLLAVALVDGQTEIGPLDAAGRDIVKRHLYTPGDLLRMEQITPAR